MRRTIRTTGFLAISLVMGAAATAGDMHPISLNRYANQPLDGAFGRAGKGNNLARLPKGEQKLGDATFNVGDGMLQLGSTVLEKFPERIDGIAVGRTCEKIHFLHSTFYGGASKTNVATDPAIVVEDGVQIGEYIVYYEDGGSEGFPIIYGRDVRDWWYYPDDSDAPSVGKVAWAGENDLSERYQQGVRIYSSAWKNPFPAKTIKSIDFVGRKDATVAAPFCVAITLEDKGTQSTKTSAPSPPDPAPPSDDSPK